MPVKVLHVLSCLELGGIERWLTHLAAEIATGASPAAKFDFLTFIQSGGCFEQTLESMGCSVYHHRLRWPDPRPFIRALRHVLDSGHYDVVHCHSDYTSGLVLTVAKRAGVPRRIAHVHSTRFAFQSRRHPPRYLAGLILRRLSIRNGTVCLGCSDSALSAYLGGMRARIPNSVCLCGIPCDKFRAAVQQGKSELRRGFGLGEGEPILLHVGSHNEVKNLHFLLEVVSAVLPLAPSVQCLLVGMGPLTQDLQRYAASLGLASRVKFLGRRDDVPHLMRAADLFLFPSHYEGLGLAVVEAQAVGLPVLMSDCIPSEATVVSDLTERLPLNATPEVWAQRSTQLLRKPPMNPRAGLDAVVSSQHNIVHSAARLLDFYRGSAPAS